MEQNVDDELIYSKEGEISKNPGDIKVEIEIGEIVLQEQNSILENHKLSSEVKAEIKYEENSDDECREEDSNLNEGCDFEADTPDQSKLTRYSDVSNTPEYEKNSICGTSKSNPPTEKNMMKYIDFLHLDSNNVLRHIKEIHDKPKTYKCSQCEYTAGQSSSLKVHIRAVHEQLKDYKCEYCEYSSGFAQNLNCHIRAVHLKLKRHKCDYCDHTASDTSKLKRHVSAVHLNMKNHKCDFCDYTASQQSSIKKHISAVHNKTKNYKCQYCDFVTIDGSKLKRHIMSVHHKMKSHKCDHCDYTASQRATVKRHINNVHR